MWIIDNHRMLKVNKTGNLEVHLPYTPGETKIWR